MDQDLIKAIEEKYRSQGENPETYLKGLLQAKSLTYWDYIQLETLLSLQRPRTDYEDEKIFIMYHQVTELTLSLILHELKQITGDRDPDADTLAEKVTRMNRYTRMLITSFDVMKDGMDYDIYNTFRNTLAPASGFQSVQFRYIELRCTPLDNLVNKRGKEFLPENPSTRDYFKNLYWRDAGYDRATGKTTQTLRLFEEKYLEELIALADSMKGKTLHDKIMKLGDNIPENLRSALKSFDRFYNVAWPMVHLNTARHYLDSKGVTKEATGGSDWKKYLHPKYQQRKFFPDIWSQEEIENWGHE